MTTCNLLFSFMDKKKIKNNNVRITANYTQTVCVEKKINTNQTYTFRFYYIYFHVIPF